MIEECRGVSGVIGRLKGSSSSLIGDSGRAATRTEDEGVGKGTQIPLLDLLALASRRFRASADVGAKLLMVGNRGSAEYGMFGIGDGVGEEARDFCRCLTRSLACNCRQICEQKVFRSVQDDAHLPSFRGGARLLVVVSRHLLTTVQWRSFLSQRFQPQFRYRRQVHA